MPAAPRTPLPFPGVFIDPEKLPVKQLFPGIAIRLAWGEKVMLSLVTLEPGGVVPEHRHPHEQAGICVSGEFELTVAGKTRVVKAGELYLIPGNTPHAARGLEERAVALDIFSPLREDYLPK